MSRQPINSMTAFARSAKNSEWGNVVWEVRSVNHRYLDPSFKLPEDMRRLEPTLREKLQAHLARGKIECLLRVEQNASGKEELKINHAAASRILEAVKALDGGQSLSPINPLELLQWPGVLQQPDLDESRFQSSVLECFEDTLGKLTKARSQEGQALAKLLVDRVDEILRIVDRVEQRIPEIIATNRKAILAKVEALEAEVDSSRIEQEILFLSQKIDVSEETDRLSTHCEEITKILKRGGSCGRRLDFLMQELNREANTLGSKSAAKDCSQAAVDLKVLIEQMREQIQNIE